MRSLMSVLTLAVVALSTPALAGPEENKVAVRRILLERLGQGRLEGGDAIYGPGFVAHGPSRDIGFEQAENNVRAVRAAFPDLQVRIERIIAEGDYVSVQWSANGTNTVRAGVFPGTGRRVEIGGITFYRFRDGRVVEEWAVSDNLSLLRQLGLLPAPAADGSR